MSTLWKEICTSRQVERRSEYQPAKACNDSERIRLDGIHTGIGIALQYVELTIDEEENDGPLLPEEIDFKCNDEESATTISKMFDCLTSYKSFTGDRSGHYHKHTKTGRIVRIWW